MHIVVATWLIILSILLLLTLGLAVAGNVQGPKTVGQLSLAAPSRQDYTNGALTLVKWAGATRLETPIGITTTDSITYTVKRAGVWLVSATLSLPNSFANLTAPYLQIQIVKNGDTTQNYGLMGYGTQNFVGVISCSAQIPFAKNDTFAITFLDDSGTGTFTGANTNLTTLAANFLSS